MCFFRSFVLHFEIPSRDEHRCHRQTSVSTLNTKQKKTNLLNKISHFSILSLEQFFYQMTHKPNKSCFIFLYKTFFLLLRGHFSKWCCLQLRFIRTTENYCACEWQMHTRSRSLTHSTEFFFFRFALLCFASLTLIVRPNDRAHSIAYVVVYDIF